MYNMWFCHLQQVTIKTKKNVYGKPNVQWIKNPCLSTENPGLSNNKPASSNDEGTWIISRKSWIISDNPGLSVESPRLLTLQFNERGLPVDKPKIIERYTWINYLSIIIIFINNRETRFIRKSGL